MTGLAVLFVAAIVVVLVVAPATGHHVLKPYQMQRLTGFLHPSHDPSNQTYNITESLTAIGSGGKTGLGTAGASQVNLHFLPAPAPTSSSPWSARPTASSALPSCYRCMH